MAYLGFGKGQIEGPGGGYGTEVFHSGVQGRSPGRGLGDFVPEAGAHFQFYI